MDLEILGCKQAGDQTVVVRRGVRGPERPFLLAFQTGTLPLHMGV
jgi:hypothetical protein